jgi:hypothetical protein
VKLPLIFAVSAAAVSVGAIALAAAQTPRPAPRAPVLVELYQSQGCSSCPPANANVNAIADRPGIVALSFGVTYWDQLGWKDTFAKPEYTARQWDYARFNKRANVATPQVWVNGRQTIVGSNAAQLSNTIAAARATAPSPRIVSGAVAVPAGNAPAGGADIWVARFDPRVVQVPIRAGENGGRTLPHRNVVRALSRVGHWTGAEMRVALPAAIGGLSTAVFLQAGRGGPVLSVARS